MSNRIRLSLLAVAVIAAVLLLVQFWRNADTSAHYEYATYADIKNDKSVHAATVPEFVPTSAREIAGSYNVEFNTQTLEFTFAAADQAAMTTHFDPLSGSEANEIEGKLRKFRWRDDPVDLDRPAIFVRRHSERIEYLLVDTEHTRAYYVAERS